MSGPKPTGRYQIRESLGSGGMGDVFAALDLKSDPPREVAIKTIRDASNPASLELFKRECSVLMSFTHPNVIEIYETGDFDDRGASKPFFVSLNRSKACWSVYGRPYRNAYITCG